jgi:type II secretory pathway pseudopilin PulG
MTFKKSAGFTLIELLLVFAFIAFLTISVIYYIRPKQLVDTSRKASAAESLKALATAANIYAAEYGDFPPDVWRDVPPELVEYLNPSSWPGAAYPDAVYDWDNWEDEVCWNGTTGIIQVTIREIEAYGYPDDYVLYYVIKGDGIPHCSNSWYQGECLNC